MKNHCSSNHGGKDAMAYNSHISISKGKLYIFIHSLARQYCFTETLKIMNYENFTICIKIDTVIRGIKGHPGNKRHFS